MDKSFRTRLVAAIVGLSVLTGILGTTATLFLSSATQANRENENLPQTTRSVEKQVIVAYAITVTDCSTGNNSASHLVDAAAVLQHSIHLASSERYGYQMYAFLHSDVRQHCHNVALALERLGFLVQWKPTPFSTNNITNADLRDKIHKQGCCGEKELVKLYTLTLTRHPIAVHLDLDTLMLQNWDHLYDVLLWGDAASTKSKQLVHRHRQQSHHSTNENSSQPASNLLTYFTRDYNMVPFVTPPTRVLMQGGFWVVRPNRTIFNDIVDMILHHGDHFSLNCGWGPCDLGSARFYGGAGFQGIISYYYGYFYRLRNGSFKSKKRNKKSKNNDKSNTFMNIPPDPHPNLVELNRCLYNSMADRARKACATNTKDQMACNHCNDTDLKDLYGAHFTLCQKPWNCGPHHNEPLCYRFHHAWHVIRADFVQQQQGTNRTVVLDDPPPDPSINHKTKKKRRNRWAQHIVQKFPSQCQSLGPEGYVPMGLL